MATTQQNKGAPPRAIILASPLFFGAAHLHHLRELTRVQLVPLPEALLVVGAQFCYTTVFGWLAAWLFLRTGHFAAPAAAHAACNALGAPRLGAMARADGRRPLGVPALWWATAAGAALFFAAAPRWVRPERFGNRLYGGAPPTMFAVPSPPQGAASPWRRLW